MENRQILGRHSVRVTIPNFRVCQNELRHVRQNLPEATDKTPGTPAEVTKPDRDKSPESANQIHAVVGCR